MDLTMTPARRAGLASLVAALIGLSAVAHAVLGWPPNRAVLVSAGVDADLVGALGASWLYGSTAMAMFAAICWHVAVLLRQGREVFVTLRIIGVGYLAFGIGALVFMRFNPFFLGFAAIGLLALAATWPERS
jgi:hypothetical protein